MIQRNSNPVRNPESYCPICGVYYLIGEHRCDERDLAEINSLESLEDDNFPEPSIGDRLEDGFGLNLEDK